MQPSSVPERMVKAEPLRNLPEAEALQSLDVAVALAIPEIRQAFLEAVKEATAATDRLQFDIAFIYGSTEEMVAAVSWRRFEEVLAEAIEGGKLREAYEGSSQMALRLVTPPLGIPLDFERIAQAAVRYVQEHGVASVTGITDETRQAFRSVLDNAFRTPTSLDAVRRDVRGILDAPQANGLIGLNTRQAAAFNRRMNAWLEDGDLSAARVQQLLNRLHGRMLRDRSDLIAHTEAYNAGNEGILQAWRQAANEGEVQIEGLGARFTSDRGESALRPLLHPKCYCSQRLVRRQVAGETVYVREWVTRVIGVCQRCTAFDGTLALPVELALAA